MTSDRRETIERLYHAALTRAVSEREDFLAIACGDDDALRREVESLLAHDGHAEFLSTPAVPTSEVWESLVGRCLGPYAMSARIGEGGMGEVYRARDAKLGRDVAIKVLPPLFTTNPERLARFEREARLLAALNHPHVGAIYGLEDIDGTPALILELVEGDTLAERIDKGPLPLADVLAIAMQMADALDAAHEKGIVHRDLKPANIKITPEGVVKVLDFGLGKAAGIDVGPDLTHSPTMSVTREGTILGTASYMSPEQARGQTVDKRADIWAFGCVVYEMLTGRVAFPGGTLSDTVAGILEHEPDWTALPAIVPPRVITVLRRCLQKDRKQRARDIGDVSLALEGAFETAVPQMTGASTPVADHGRLAWAVATLAVIGLATVSFLRVRETPVERSRVHLSVPLPGDAAPGYFALSPDGRSLVMGYFQNGLWGLGIRSVESGEIRLLTGTRGARTPFWSPDSRAIAFFADGQLKTIAASGGPPQTLCDDVGLGGGGAWNRAGVIVFATDSAVLTRVSAAGGACTALSKPGPDKGRPIPVFLPDGDHFLYVLGGTDEARRGLYVASLSDANGHRLLADPSSAVFVPNGPGSSQGRLLFVREQTLMAQTFDTTSLQRSGEPVTVANEVSFTDSPPQIAASADANGTVVYLTNGRPERQLIRYDRSGAERGRAAMTGSGQAIAVSLAPDGKRVAFRRTDAQGLVSLWVQDLERNQETRLTTPPRVPSAAVWAPDGQRIAFRATGAGADGIYIKNVNGGKEAMLLPGSNSWAPSDWSRDDHSLVYTETNPNTSADIWLLADPSKPSAERKPVPLLRTPSIESQGQISPDGKWLAYVSNESGTSQVYLRPFDGRSPASDTRWQVSSMNGFEPRWREDGKELFFLLGVQSDRAKVMAVPIGAAPNPAGTPTPLFEFQSLGTITQSNAFRYSPAAAGQRFLVNADATKVQPSLEVILNWGRPSSGK